MAPPSLTKEVIELTLKILAESKGSQIEAARRLQINRSSLTNRLHRASILGLTIPRYEEVVKEIKPALDTPVSVAISDPLDRVLAVLRKIGSGRLEDIAKSSNLTNGQTLDVLERLEETTLNLHHANDIWAIEKTQAQAFTSGASLQYTSNKDNTFTFGVTADNHLGSRYERLDCLVDTYNRFKAAGITKVFNCGNYIEGEARFNKHEIHTHGMDPQIDYLIKNYPCIPGIATYAVSGNDHEGWYAAREGIDIGKHVENMMRTAGRTDWHNLGYMEAHVELVNANTGKSAVLAVVHPGGGSAYSDSYAVQKAIESLDGGEKPAVALYGHYHKMLAGEYRNVWWVLVPSTKDQDTFMRGRKLRSVVGAGLISLEQDPETGAIIGMTPKLWRYFAKGYYSNRWSHAGPVTLPERDTK